VARAGHTWSDAGSARGTVEQTTDDLHLLLRRAGIKPPIAALSSAVETKWMGHAPTK
jgi:hypothetical protein